MNTMGLKVLEKQLNRISGAAIWRYFLAMFEAAVHTEAQVP